MGHCLAYAVALCATFVFAGCKDPATPRASDDEDQAGGRDPAHASSKPTSEQLHRSLLNAHGDPALQETLKFRMSTREAYNGSDFAHLEEVAVKMRDSK